MFSTERRKTKGKLDIHLPDKNKINNNYKCTVGIHIKTDELTKQTKNNKRPTTTTKNKQTKKKRKEIKKQSTNTGPTFLREKPPHSSRLFPVALGCGRRTYSSLKPRVPTGGGL